MPKETIPGAIKKHPKRRKEEAAKDTLFAIVGSFRTKEGNWSERDDWRE